MGSKRRPVGMVTYRLAPAAESDLYRLWLYGVQQWGVEAADNYQRDLHERFAAIAANPLQYPAIDHIRSGYRRSVFRNNGIYYRINVETVEIMAIIGQQDLDEWL